MFPVVYQHAAKVAPGPTPGAKALMAWCLANYPPGTNLGIYNPRNVRGGQALSLHAEGRAIDVGYPIDRPLGYAPGRQLAADMVRHHQALGVQCVIFARSIWTNTHPTWRPYTGTADHFDHVHIELTREAAAGLTTDIIRQTMEPTVPTTDPVKASQQRLNDSGARPPLVVDGVWGPACDAALDAVLKFQQGQMADLRKANATSADTIKRLNAERAMATEALDKASAGWSAAEAEALQLRRQLQTGGRMPQLLADLDAALAKARA